MTDANALDLDLHTVDLGDEGMFVEQISEGMALGTFSSTSTASTASCPFSSAGSAMTAGTAG